MMTELEAKVTDPGFVGHVLTTSTGKKYIVKSGDNFKYTDPIDNSVTAKQVKQIINILFNEINII